MRLKAYIVLRMCVVVVCFNGVAVVIVSIQNWRPYYINIGAGANITCKLKLILSLNQTSHYIVYTTVNEVHLVLY